MDDAELQDEPLQVRLMDHDTYSANDMIGKVYFNLNPLLLNSTIAKSSHISSPGISVCCVYIYRNRDVLYLCD